MKHFNGEEIIGSLFRELKLKVKRWLERND